MLGKEVKNGPIHVVLAPNLLVRDGVTHPSTLSERANSVYFASGTMQERNSQLSNLNDHHGFTE